MTTTLTVSNAPEKGKTLHGAMIRLDQSTDGSRSKKITTLRRTNAARGRCVAITHSSCGKGPQMLDVDGSQAAFTRTIPDFRPVS
jgi:hypothetical protein